MGKPAYMYTDSDTEETSCSSVASENIKKRNKFSILKYNNSNVKKKKCKIHSKSEPEDSDYRSRSRSRAEDSDYRSRSRSRVRYRLPGILKHSEVRDSSDDEDDSEPAAKPYSQSRYLVGRVPRPAGAKPGRGGGVAIIIKKNISRVPTAPIPQISSTHTKKKSWCRRLSKKRSY